MPWRIVVDADAQEVFRYATTFPEQFTDQYPLETFTHLLTDNGSDPDSVTPHKADDGSLSLVPNVEWYWTALRTERNRRLTETDWVALADAHLSQDKKDAWFAYRQELRDLPESVQNPMDSVPWPLKPGELPPPPPVAASRLGALLEYAGVTVAEEPAPEVQEPVVEVAPEPVVEAEAVQEPVVEPVSAPEPDPVVEEPAPEPVVESTVV